MPNGIDKNLVRLCYAVDIFRQYFGRWPERVVVPPITLADIRSLLSSDQWDAIAARINLIEGEGTFRVQDDDGNWFQLGDGTSSRGEVEPPVHEEADQVRSAREWLGLDRWSGPPSHPHDAEDHV
ncbi:MAG: hypothetical protein RLN75_03080 [Longimicrobiales bacterium]